MKIRKMWKKYVLSNTIKNAFAYQLNKLNYGKTFLPRGWHNPRQQCDTLPWASMHNTVLLLVLQFFSVQALIPLIWLQLIFIYFFIVSLQKICSIWDWAIITFMSSLVKLYVPYIDYVTWIWDLIILVRSLKTLLLATVIPSPSWTCRKMSE